MKISEVLKQAKSLIDTPEKWTKGKNACDSKGNEVSIYSQSATCFCSIGALSVIMDYHFMDDITYEFEMKTKNYLMESMNGWIWTFNDSHTHEEVMKAWDEAILKAEKDEALHSR